MAGKVATRTAIVFDIVETKNQETGAISYSFKQIDLDADLPDALGTALGFDEKNGDLRVDGWYETDNGNFSIRVRVKIFGAWKSVGTYSGNVSDLFQFSINLPLLGSATLKIVIIDGILCALFSVLGQDIRIDLLRL